MLLKLIIKFLSVFLDVVKFIMGKFYALVFVNFLFVEGGVDNCVALLYFRLDFDGELIFEKLIFFELVVVIICLEIFSHEN